MRSDEWESQRHLLVCPHAENFQPNHVVIYNAIFVIDTTILQQYFPEHFVTELAEVPNNSESQRKSIVSDLIS